MEALQTAAPSDIVKTTDEELESTSDEFAATICSAVTGV